MFHVHVFYAMTFSLCCQLVNCTHSYIHMHFPNGIRLASAVCPTIKQSFADRKLRLKSFVGTKIACSIKSEQCLKKVNPTKSGRRIFISLYDKSTLFGLVVKLEANVAQETCSTWRIVQNS